MNPTSNSSFDYEKKILFDTQYGPALVIDCNIEDRGIWKTLKSFGSSKKLVSIFPNTYEEEQINRWINKGINVIIQLANPAKSYSYWVFKEDNKVSQSNVNIKSYDDVQKIEFYPYGWLPSKMKALLSESYDDYIEKSYFWSNCVNKTYVYNLEGSKGRLIITDQIDSLLSPPKLIRTNRNTDKNTKKSFQGKVGYKKNVIHTL